jgi:hypothetical protein
VCGVVGLAPSGGNQDVFGTIFGSGSLPANTYSMCFYEGSKSNGTFTLGGADSRLYHGEIQYVPNGGGFGGYNCMFTQHTRFSLIFRTSSSPL